VGPVPSYRLNLPTNWNVHNVFHPSKLKRYYYDESGPHPLQCRPPQEREIEKIVATRTLSNGQRQLLIQWKDHSPVYNIWLDDNDIVDESSLATLVHGRWYVGSKLLLLLLLLLLVLLFLLYFYYYHYHITTILFLLSLIRGH
jgi:hypothetical protein